MAIPCPGCGREYDVTLFQFGRTIHCTCGARVGLEMRIGPELPSGRPRFLADAMLGGLARWLRILGFDAAYDPAISDRDLVRRGVLEGRYILSKDRGLSEAWRVARCVILDSDESEAQLREVVDRFDLRGEIRLFTRCTVCNASLEPISKREVRDRVPEKVAESQDSFQRCPDCRRIYWSGSHTDRMRGRLREILGD